ncbi:MAG: hypothetical protein ABIH76_09120, partial [Candidatus Bathyarchaeota archaeon]
NKDKTALIAEYLFKQTKYGPVGYALPQGNRKELALNVLIVVLVEYARAEFSGINHFAAIARKFESSKFNMSGWSQSKVPSRRKISERYRTMQGNFDIKEIYKVISAILTPHR